MFSDALRILDRNTVQLMIDEMSDELAEMKNERELLKNETNELRTVKEQLQIERNTLASKIDKNILKNDNCFSKCKRCKGYWIINTLHPFY